MNFILPVFALAQREWIRFYRQPSRVLGAVLQPFLFWMLVGTGMTPSFSGPINEQKYLDYFFPGILLMILMFTAIFSTFSIIDDRKEGILLDVMASPTTPLALVLGRVLGGAFLGLAQTLVFLPLLLTPWLELSITPGALVILVMCMTLTALMLTALGFFMAWSMDSTQGFHAVISLVLFPLWMFSGAVFPASPDTAWLYVLMQVNPMSHSLYLIQAAFSQDAVSAFPMVSLGVVTGWAFVLVGLSVWRVGRPR